MVGEEWGAVSRYARKIGVPQTTFNNYVLGKRSPSLDILFKIAERGQVSLNWLINGEGDKWLTQESDVGESHRKIPVLGRVPAGPPGGQRWSEYDAQDVFETLTIKDDMDLIALEVQGESMYPTLFPGDKIVMTPNARWRTGDLVVAEIEGSGDDYQVKRLGRSSEKETVLISDNMLKFPPQSYEPKRVEIRGLVTGIMRRLERRGPGKYGDPEWAEVFNNPQIQKMIELLPHLSETAQMAILDNIKTFAKAKL